MTIELCINRSSEWVRSRRLATGQNIREDITVKVNPADLSLESRTFLLDYGFGSYPDVNGSLKFNQQLQWDRRSFYGSISLFADSDSPTPEQIDQAIADADTQLADKRREWEINTAERKAKEEVERKAKEEKAAAISAARELLADEIGKLKERGTESEKNLKIVSTLLSWVPDDAIRGAAKALAADRSVKPTDVLEEALNASPIILLAQDEDEAEDEE